MLEKLTIKHHAREKLNFHCSDYGKSQIDLFLSLAIKIPKTNAPNWYDMLRMGAGNGAEVYMLQTLKDSDIVDEYYDQDYDGRVEMEREGVKITGYMDAVSKTGFPIEIKTINNKNAWDIKKYQENNPRESYVGQLATYMDFLGVDTGYLFVSSIDGLNRFWFECKRIGNLRYQCGNTIVDLDKEYKRWRAVWDVMQTSGEPTQDMIWEYKYKIPVEEIDWKTISPGDISKARNGHKVIGDYQVSYSDYKDLIIALQGSELGYSVKEIEYIRSATEGYTTWKK